MKPPSGEPPLSVTLPLLEQRPYLHGTTLFNHLLGHCTSPGRLRFKINRMMRTNRVTIHRLTPGSAEAAGMAASLFWNEGDQARALGATPLPAREPIRRERYDEARIVAQTAFDDGCARLTETTGYSLAANLIAVNKAYLTRELKPPGAGQWVFTRLDLAALPEAPAPFELSVARALGTRLVESSIQVGDSRVGSVFFSWMAG